MKIVDASAVVDVLLGTPRAAPLMVHLDDDPSAPELLITGVQSVLRRMVHADRLSGVDAAAAHAALLRAPVEFVPAWPYAETIWAWRETVSPNDGCYVALALDLNAPLLTTDLRLARAVERMIAVIPV